MCSWKTGKVIPSDEKLQGFINNLLPVCREREWWFWITKTAIAMNRLYFELKIDPKLEKYDVASFFESFRFYRAEVKKRVQVD